MEEIKTEEAQKPVAWMSSRNGFICKENKNPEYNIPLYPHPHPKAAAVPEVVLKALKSCQRKQIIHECAPAENYKTFDSDLVAEAIAALEAAPSLPVQSEHKTLQEAGPEDAAIYQRIANNYNAAQSEGEQK